MVKLAEFTGFRNAGGTVSGAPAKPSIHPQENAARLVYSRVCLKVVSSTKKELAGEGCGVCKKNNEPFHASCCVRSILLLLARVCLQIFVWVNSEGYKTKRRQVFCFFLLFPDFECGGDVGLPSTCERTYAVSWKRLRDD